MAKINTLSVEGSKQKGFTVTAMLDDGNIVDIKEGFEFGTAAEFEKVRAECDTDRDTMRAANDRDMEALQTENDRLKNAANEQMDKLYAEIGQLKQQIAAKPEEVRVPLMHAEHQDIPTARTVDKLAPIGALAPAPTIDEPPQRPLNDPDAPARPPGPGEVAAVRGEYRGSVGDNTAYMMTNDEINE